MKVQVMPLDVTSASLADLVRLAVRLALSPHHHFQNLTREIAGDARCCHQALRASLKCWSSPFVKHDPEI
jgi:hypothetical protein